MENHKDPAPYSLKWKRSSKTHNDDPIIFSKDTKDREKEKEKYLYHDAGTFQTALNYYNRMWEVKAIKKQKKVDHKSFPNYIQKISLSSTGNCTKCKEDLTGKKHFVNDNKTSQMICYLCLCKILMKTVGEDKDRIKEELTWLDQQR